jgi:hypothetical protein
VRLSFWCPERQREVNVEATVTPFEDLLLEDALVSECLWFRVNGCDKRGRGGCLVGKHVQGRFTRKLEG